jgi:hypothetical protein
VRTSDLNQLIEARTGPSRSEYRGFGILFRGIIPAQDTETIHGHFVAYSLHDKKTFFYSGLDGMTKQFNSGDRFEFGSEHVDAEDLYLNGADKAITLAMDAKRRLLKIIDEHIGEFWGGGHIYA